VSFVTDFTVDPDQPRDWDEWLAEETLWDLLDEQQDPYPSSGKEGAA
jgi:hypothetical protein